MEKRIQKLTKKASKFPKLANTDPEDSDDDDDNDDDDDDDKKEPVVKKAPDSPGLVETDRENSGDSDTEDTLRATGFPVDKSLEVGKNEEEPIFKRGINRSKKISYVAKI